MAIKVNKRDLQKWKQNQSICSPLLSLTNMHVGMVQGQCQVVGPPCDLTPTVYINH